jgi:hypothetical protein
MMMKMNVNNQHEMKIAYIKKKIREGNSTFDDIAEFLDKTKELHKTVWDMTGVDAGPDLDWPTKFRPFYGSLSSAIINLFDFRDEGGNELVIGSLPVTAMYIADYELYSGFSLEWGQNKENGVCTTLEKVFDIKEWANFEYTVSEEE